MALVDYTETNLRRHRFDIPGQVWLQDRLDGALDGRPEEPSTPARHRGDVMSLVSEAEVAVAPR